MDVHALRPQVLGWYARNKRHLPWRGRDLYGVWVSEVMLQQTRVDVAMPYYERWMERWPTVQALAAAPQDDVLSAWAGLGYYSRARSLHQAAKMVVRYGWPQDLAGWLALPGVGPYTAAAVTSIALNQPHACVDGNVARVTARLLAEGRPLTDRAAARRIQAAAQEHLEPAAPGDWNQALMDLGATICTPRAPRCDACPVTTSCAARARGEQHLIPTPKARPAPRVERRHVAVVRHRGAILVVRPVSGLLRGMWGLPGAARAHDLPAHVQRLTGIEVRLGPRPATAVHRFSHRTWDLRVWLGRPATGRGRSLPDGVAWLRVADLATSAVPAATRAALAAAGVVPPATKAKRAPGSPRP